MHYVSVENVTKNYGIKPLFARISFHIEEGDRIALVARNGSGKSTLLKILAGKETADSGKVWVHKEVDIALFEQEPQFEENKTILDNIFFHEHPVINIIKEYERLSETERPGSFPTRAVLAFIPRSGPWSWHRFPSGKGDGALASCKVHPDRWRLGNLS